MTKAQSCNSLIVLESKEKRLKVNKGNIKIKKQKEGSSALAPVWTLGSSCLGVERRVLDFERDVLDICWFKRLKEFQRINNTAEHTSHNGALFERSENSQICWWKGSKGLLASVFWFWLPSMSGIPRISFYFRSFMFLILREISVVSS